jgi:hypothetical protein
MQFKLLLNLKRPLYGATVMFLLFYHKHCPEQLNKHCMWPTLVQAWVQGESKRKWYSGEIMDISDSVIYSSTCIWKLILPTQPATTLLDVLCDWSRDTLPFSTAFWESGFSVLIVNFYIHTLFRSQTVWSLTFYTRTAFFYCCGLFSYIVGTDAGVDDSPLPYTVHLI